MNQSWEPLATGVYRCRLAFLDVTVDLILGRDAALLIDNGTTFDEARSIDADVRSFDERGVSHLVLTTTTSTISSGPPFSPGPRSVPCPRSRRQWRIAPTTCGNTRSATVPLRRISTR